VTHSDLQKSIDEAISKNESLENISMILKGYKEKEVDKSTVVHLLESMRTDADEEYEDRLLEILDIVTGHCNPKYTVW